MNNSDIRPILYLELVFAFVLQFCGLVCLLLVSMLVFSNIFELE